ncbi:uncharacterized protein LOC129288969 isoform X2 [Prosopis cineraria]|nr:uncharacterized protein LOC129288969 isoform X2 [Prosopis cineraria]XP_054781770.1 uncharacterized protein LOC129288969 isoform X2 [Prosopis cineraria]
MGRSEEGVENGGCNKETQKKVMLIFLSSFLVSMVGSFLLGWWIHKYHPTNSELWMVPVGLILSVTPVIVGLSLVISSPSFSRREEEEIFYRGSSTVMFPETPSCLNDSLPTFSNA